MDYPDNRFDVDVCRPDSGTATGSVAASADRQMFIASGSTYGTTKRGVVRRAHVP